MYTPTGYWFVRNAQLANDQEFLEDLARRLRANTRYAGLNSRTQKRLNRVLFAFTMGGRRSFEDATYRERIRLALSEVYQEAPEDDPAWAVLETPKTFNRHLRRLNLLGATEP